MRINLDHPLYIDEICLATNANVIGCIRKAEAVNCICTDTRECKEGDLFIALKGKNDCGEKYVNEALQKTNYVISSSYSPSVIHVHDTSDALLLLAKYYKSKIGIKYTVAVTGSVGKSTTVKFISKLLNQRYKVHSPNGNFNNHIGVPLTVLSIPKNTEILVTEFGMNHRNEISRLSKSITPDIGVITSVGTSHIGNLGSRENIAKAKLEIFDGIKEGTVLLPYSEALLNGIKGGLYVALNSPLSDFSINKLSDSKYSFSSIFGNISYIAPFDIPKHLHINLAFAISVAKILGLSTNEINNGIKSITSADLSQRFIELNDYTILDDSYNASLESVKADIEYIASLGRPCGALLGDILELGNNATIIHENIGRIAAQLGIDHLYLYGSYAETIARGAIDIGMNPENIFLNTDTSSPEISISHIKKHHNPGEIILFKASHKLRLDAIADMIKKQERTDNDH